jgi:hypothetical protein
MNKTIDNRAAGAALLISAFLSVVAMAHHPSGAHATGALAGMVHGAMIALLLFMLFGWAKVVLKRGVCDDLLLGGLVAYAASASAHVAAATINGFAVPALAARGVEHNLFSFAWELNQAFAYLGAYLSSAAFFLWSADFVVKGPGTVRILGFAGLAAAICPAAALATGTISMDVEGAFVIYASHAAFTALAAIEMLRGRL